MYTTGKGKLKGKRNTHTAQHKQPQEGTTAKLLALRTGKKKGSTNRNRKATTKKKAHTHTQTYPGTSNRNKVQVLS